MGDGGGGSECFETERFGYSVLPVTMLDHALMFQGLVDRRLLADAILEG